MNLLTVGLLAWALLLASCMGVAALAGDRLHHDSKPLGEIVEVLEKSGYVVVDAEIDDGRWEIDAHKDDVSYELHINPVTGETIATYRDTTAYSAPPVHALKLSKLLKEVGKGGYSPILSAEFKHGRWEVEAHKDGQKRELEIGANDGKIVADRVDH